MTKNEILNCLTAHKAEFKERFGVIRIGLFGSFARDEQNEDSDKYPCKNKPALIC